MQNEGGPQVTQEVNQKAEEGEINSSGAEHQTSFEGSQLVDSFLKSKEFISNELAAVFATAKEGIVKEITSSVMEQLNKKLEENMKLNAETYKTKSEDEEGVEKIIAGAKEMKMTY